MGCSFVGKRNEDGRLSRQIVAWCSTMFLSLLSEVDDKSPRLVDKIILAANERWLAACWAMGFGAGSAVLER